MVRHNFGWLSAQYHVMGWALSCLKLAEHYDDIHLYTDSNGYEILVDYLKLPYTSIHNCYNTFPHEHMQLWALPKVMTYAAQTAPFIHVDGDVFIWEKFSPDLEKAALIAQNFEKGTSYYKEIMDTLKTKLKYIPDELQEELNKESICAYNAGILGGNDYSFFKGYGEAVFEFIQRNCPKNEHSLSSNMNVLFEQVLFYVLSSTQNKNVTCLVSKKIEDNGYSQKDFSDFTAVPYKLKYLHLIGNNKRHKETCEMMSRTLLSQYPEYFYKIIALFKQDHTFFKTRINPVFSFQYPGLSLFIGTTTKSADTVVCQASNVTAFPALTDKWKNINPQELYTQELASISYYHFFFQPKPLQLQTMIMINPYIEITEVAEAEAAYNIEEQHNAAGNDTINPCALASVPELFFEGVSHISIDELDYNILIVLNVPLAFGDVLTALDTCFSEIDRQSNQQVIYELVLTKLKFLFHNKCIFICPIP